jgi:hypothetical protein
VVVAQVRSLRLVEQHSSQRENHVAGKIDGMLDMVVLDA